MAQITLDHQVLQYTCVHCKQTFTVSRGSVYESGEGIAIYLAAMHTCCSGKTVDLAISIREGYKAFPLTSAITLKVRPTEKEFQMTITDPQESTWQAEAYLGKMMSRDEALSNSLIDSFFLIADHIVLEIPEINDYLAK